ELRDCRCVRGVRPHRGVVLRARGRGRSCGRRDRRVRALAPPGRRRDHAPTDARRRPSTQQRTATDAGRVARAVPVARGGQGGLERLKRPRSRVATATRRANEELPPPYPVPVAASSTDSRARGGGGGGARA